MKHGEKISKALSLHKSPPHTLSNLINCIMLPRMSLGALIRLAGVVNLSHSEELTSIRIHNAFGEQKHSSRHPCRLPQN